MDNLEIPNVLKLSENIISVLEFIDEHKLKECNSVEALEKIEQNFPEFYDRYYSLTNLLLSGEDIDKLIQMLQILHSVEQQNISVEDAVDTIHSNLADEYVMPKLSNKQKKKLKKHKN
jgi:pyruvate formate-lyase activating enzyme-like uncharacterized protein